MALRSALEPRTKAAYAAAVKAVREQLRSRRPEGSPPPSRDQRVRHYLLSLLSIYDVEGLIELGVPWWSYRAIDVVEGWLDGRDGDTRVFEYGSGASTVWLAERCSQVISVEHDTEFAEVIGPVLSGLDGVDFRVRPPVADRADGIRSGRSGYEHLDFTHYVHEIDAVGGSFDLIVVDGRARADALSHALGHLNPGGIVVFDNASRSRYQSAISAADLPTRMLRGLTPALPYPTTTAVLGPAS